MSTGEIQGTFAFCQSGAEFGCRIPIGEPIDGEGRHDLVSNCRHGIFGNHCPSRRPRSGAGYGPERRLPPCALASGPMRIRAGRARRDALERAVLRKWLGSRAGLRSWLEALYVLWSGCARGFRDVLM